MIELHLRIQVKQECQADFYVFLGEAIPFYERPGGIRVRLLQDVSEPTRYIELVEYADEATYQKDQERVEHDEQMKAYLGRWRNLLEFPPLAEVYRRTEV